MARDWSRLEVEVTVADYFDMLASELRDEPYNKSAHRRALSALLDDRSDGAIERKHQNISAVLSELGCPPIPGYKPLSNYQQILFDVVAEHLATDDNIARLARGGADAEATTPELPDILDRLVRAPELSETDRSRTYEKRRPRPRVGVDYLAREARNASLGRAGEEFVVSFERARLARAGRSDLAELVEHVAVTQGDGLGFDIWSYDTTGDDRLIEVKTTAYGMYTPFFVTSNELSVSRERTAQFHLYRPFTFRRDPKLFSVRGPLDEACRLDPTQYRARIV